jgi:squalene synthase HpnC
MTGRCDDVIPWQKALRRRTVIRSPIPPPPAVDAPSRRPIAPALDAPSLVRAYAACEAMARAHYENFPVASWLLPRGTRPHVAAVYAFARVADDIADEGRAPAAERQRLLDAWLRRLHAAVAVEQAGEPPHAHEDLLLAAMAHSIRSLELPLSLFDDLVSAFRQDTMTVRYASWADVFDYCRRSADPVGRLVLRIAGYRDAALDRSSDAVCTALQLTNFWQDFGRDWRSGRLYVPREVQDACGADEADLESGRMTPAWAEAIDECAIVTRDRFAAGRAVCDGVHGRLRVELRLTWLGGTRMLERVQRLRADLLHRRPTLGARDLPALIWRAARWREAAG